MAFTVTNGARGVAFEVRSFSRRVDPLARLGAPFARALQNRVTARYLEGLADAAAATDGTRPSAPGAISDRVACETAEGGSVDGRGRVT